LTNKFLKSIFSQPCFTIISKYILVNLALLSINKEMKKDKQFQDIFEEKKQESTFQILFKGARLINKKGLEMLREKYDLPNLRPSHMNLLPHIDLDGTRISEIAQKLSISKQAVSQLVEDLEKMSTVERVSDPCDGRAKLVRFTNKGKQGLLEGLGVLKDLEEQLVEKIGRKKMNDLRETIKLLIDEVTIKK
jgi:DNA-binding MarR family transcriptional regulator